MKVEVTFLNTTSGKPGDLERDTIEADKAEVSDTGALILYKTKPSGNMQPILFVRGGTWRSYKVING